MKFYSYKMSKDYGFAPNPFGGICSLATCKGNIRQSAELGNWILATGSKEIRPADRIIYCMKVTEKLTFEEYWNDPRFQFKKPIANGSLTKIHGDNVYSKDSSGIWIQHPCQHSFEDGSPNPSHLESDTNGLFVLLSNHFFYFGSLKVQMPSNFRLLLCKSRDREVKSDKYLDLCNSFIKWLSDNFNTGILGDPYHWKIYKQTTLFQ